MLKATKIVREDEYGEWSVQLLDSESGRHYWMDAFYNERYKDINVEWNQYIFYLTDKDELARKAFQENCENFDEAVDAVMGVLMDTEVYRDENDEYCISVDSDEWYEETEFDFE